MPSFLLALDQGTTSSRALLFDQAGREIAKAQRPLAARFPQPGWVEQDGMEIWQTQLACLREVVAQAGIAVTDIAAIGISNQRETTLLWDRKTSTPVGPAIVWQDRRTAGRCDELRAAGEADDIRQRTGLEIDAYFSATKLAWLLDQVPGARRRAEAGELAFGTVDSWLIWQLTGGARHVTDPSNAARTLLFNLATGDWDELLLARFNIPAAVLPAIVPSSGVLGDVSAEWLGRAVPIAGVAGDQQAASFGQACFQPGMAKNTYGTGCFLMRNTGTASVVSANRLLTTLGWTIGGRSTYMLEGSVFMGGAVVQWLRDGLGLIRNATEVETLARSVPDSDGVVLVPAFTGLGAPYWDAHARGLLIGMTRGTTAGHIACAALDAIALQTLDLVAAMDRDIGTPLQMLRVDGGASRNDFLMQRQADLLGIPIMRPRQTETTALGAAWLAGLGVGRWTSLDELAGQWQLDRSFEPTLGEDQRTAIHARWRRAVERCRGWADSGAPT